MSATLGIDSAAVQQRVRELPALPQAVLEVLAILRSDDARAQDCAERIARDQAMTARTLKLANSAFYGVAGRVGTIRDAINMLGRRTVGSLLTTAAVSAQFSATRCPGFEFSSFWRHSIGTAIGAQALARELRLDEDVAFTAGLLHDIGRLALAAHFPAEMAAALAQALAADTPLLACETASLGIDHQQVGALIAQHWRFPPAVVQAIAHHHAPSAVATPAAGPSIADVAHLADAVAHALDLAGCDAEMVPDIDAQAWDRMALSPAAHLRAFQTAETGVVALCQALGV